MIKQINWWTIYSTKVHCGLQAPCRNYNSALVLGSRSVSVFAVSYLGWSADPIFMRGIWFQLCQYPKKERLIKYLDTGPTNIIVFIALCKHQLKKWLELMNTQLVSSLLLMGITQGVLNDFFNPRLWLWKITKGQFCP